MEKYILTRSMHLGYIKETFGRGSVITFDPRTRQITIDGRRFEDYRDIEILKRQAAKTPHNPYIILYSEEALAEMTGATMEAEPAIPSRAPNSEGLSIVQSDEDSHDMIDISHTKVSAINQQKREAQRQRVQDEGMEIVRGDESVEERIARLKEADDKDLSARAERVRLMSERQAKMPVIHDDSLGHAGGSKSASMNAGMPISGRRVDEADERHQALARARKEEAQIRRQQVLAEEGLPADMDIEVGAMPGVPATDASEAIPESVPSTLDEVAAAPIVDAKDAEIARLKAELAAKNAPPAVDPRDAEIARLKAELEGDSVESKAPPKARKMPVIDPADAERFAKEG